MSGELYISYGTAALRLVVAEGFYLIGKIDGR